MCNCSSSPCNQCSTGQSCNCPPDYSIIPVPANCGCCPPGATYINPSVNNPSGKCVDSFGNTVPSIACTDCVDSTFTDCVTYQLNPGNPINCFGIASGDNMTTILQKICANLASTVLSQISNSPTLQTILCNLNALCPPSGKGNPVITVSNYCCIRPYIYISPLISGVPSQPNGSCSQSGTPATIILSSPPQPC